MKRIGLAWIFLVAGCTVHVEPGTSDPTKYPNVTLDAANRVLELQSSPEGARVLGKVEAIACQKATHEPLPTNEAAKTLLKAKAAALGATAVVDVKFTHQNISLGNNCWDTIVATGTAVTVP